MLLASVFQRTFTTLALGLAGLNVQAQTVLPLETRSLYLQAGVDQQSTRAWTVGLTLPWVGWQRSWWGVARPLGSVCQPVDIGRLHRPGAQHRARHRPRAAPAA